MGFPGGSDGKESACIAGDLGSIPGSGRSHGQRSLAGYSPGGWKESDTTEPLALSLSIQKLLTYSFVQQRKAYNRLLQFLETVLNFLRLQNRNRSLSFSFIFLNVFINK